MESPVCTPIGSTFSIEQMMTQLSAGSRITSSSYSFHPAIDFSMSTSPIGLAEIPVATTSRNSSSVCAIPIPLPPRMYAGRTMSGRPISCRTTSASSKLRATPLCGTLSPISSMAILNFSRSSAVAIASAFAPISSGLPGTPTTPFSNNAIARFSAVCPPRVGNTASGFSRSMIASRTSGVSGSM